MYTKHLFTLLVSLGSLTYAEDVAMIKELIAMNPSYLEASAAFLQKLLQIPSVNGEHTEAAVVEAIAQEAQKLGLPYRIFEKEPGRPNIFVGEGFEDANSLLLIAHTDTVPVPDVSGWKHPPFSGKIEEGKIYGRGAIDCKGGVAISLYVLKILKDAGKLPNAKFVGVADEESGASSPFGLRYLLEEGLNAKGAVYTYGGTSYERMHIGHRGVLRVWVTLKGESVHSGLQEWQERKKGQNAIDLMNTFIHKMQTLYFPGDDPYFPGYQFVATPTLLEAGVGESIVPSDAKILYDIRTLPGQSSEQVLRAIEEILQEMNPKHGYHLEVKTCIPAVISDPENPFITKAKILHEKIFGNVPQLVGSGPANESYMLIQRGIPAIAGYGPLGEGFHGKDEYAQIDSLEKNIWFLLDLSLEHIL